MPPSRVDFRAEVASVDHHPTAANAHEVWGRDSWSTLPLWLWR